MRDHRLQGRHILVVDDTHDNRLLFATMLKSAGATTELANNGREGCDKALSGIFDAILMDISMPVFDGFEAASELRAKKYTKPIIALSGHDLKATQSEALRNGFTGYLQKPVDRLTMIEVVATILEY